MQAVNEEYVLRRLPLRRRRLRCRVSDRKRSNDSLGWVPFKAVAIQCRSPGVVRVMGRRLRPWDSWDLSKYCNRCGSVCEDGRARWHLNALVRVKREAAPLHAPSDAIAIDLGLKDLSTTSAGLKVEAARFYPELEGKLAVAQRAGKKARARAIHARLKNRRSDHLHQLSRNLVVRHGAIFVGTVSVSALAQTALAKSVLDAGWSVFRTQLRYQCHQARAVLLEVEEAGSTQSCSRCHRRTGPKGLQGLGVREGLCSGCAALHDRDVNAARLILAAGRRRLAAGILARPAPAAA